MWCLKLCLVLLSTLYFCTPTNADKNIFSDIAWENLYGNSYIVNGSMYCETGAENSYTIFRGRGAPVAYSPWTLHMYHTKDGRIKATPCTGSLIGLYYVLTAGICVKSFNVHHMSIGENFIDSKYTAGIPISQWVEGDRDYYAPGIIVHPQYDSFPSIYNLAVIRSNRNIIFNDVVSPVCLPRRPPFDFGNEFLLAGWANIRVHPSNAQTIYMFQDKIAAPDFDNCKNTLKTVFPQFTDHLICPPTQNLTATCEEDFGTSLVRNEKFEVKVTFPGYTTAYPFIYGIGTKIRGSGCNKYRAYVNVWKHMDFILDAISSLA